MSIKASNNVFPHDPDDNWRQKLDRGGYSGTAQDIVDSINNIAAPDAILIRGQIIKDVNQLSIVENSYTCRINQHIITNSQPYSTTIDPAQEGFYRIDILVFTQNGTILKIKGDEDNSNAQEPDTPDGTLQISFTTIFGSNISDPQDPITGGEYVDRISHQDISGRKTFREATRFRSDATDSYTEIFDDEITIKKNQDDEENKGSIKLTAPENLSGDFVQQLPARNGVVANIDQVQEKDKQILISENSNIDNSWNGKTILFTASCTVVVPETIINELDFVFRTLSGVNVTWAKTSPFEWETTPSVTGEKTNGHFMRIGNTNTIILDF